MFLCGERIKIICEKGEMRVCISKILQAPAEFLYSLYLLPHKHWQSIAANITRKKSIRHTIHLTKGSYPTQEPPYQKPAFSPNSSSLQSDGPQPWSDGGPWGLLAMGDVSMVLTGVCVRVGVCTCVCAHVCGCVRVCTCVWVRACSDIQCVVPRYVAKHHTMHRTPPHSKELSDPKHPGLRLRNPALNGTPNSQKIQGTGEQVKRQHEMKSAESRLWETEVSTSTTRATARKRESWKRICRLKET